MFAGIPFTVFLECHAFQYLIAVFCKTFALTCEIRKARSQPSFFLALKWLISSQTSVFRIRLHCIILKNHEVYVKIRTVGSDIFVVGTFSFPKRKKRKMIVDMEGIKENICFRRVKCDVLV